MKKSSLLLNSILIGLMFLACHKKGASENDANAANGGAGNDSAAMMIDTMTHDTLKPMDNTKMPGETQSTKPIGSVTPDPKGSGKDKSAPKRIEHGSDNQAKLDSIKNAKGKEKH